jgi:hypothetical protein
MFEKGAENNHGSDSDTIERLCYTACEVVRVRTAETDHHFDHLAHPDHVS